MKTAPSLLNRLIRAGLRPLMASAALLLTAVVARADTWVQCLPC